MIISSLFHQHDIAFSKPKQMMQRSLLVEQCLLFNFGLVEFISVKLWWCVAYYMHIHVCPLEEVVECSSFGEVTCILKALFDMTSNISYINVDWCGMFRRRSHNVLQIQGKTGSQEAMDLTHHNFFSLCCKWYMLHQMLGRYWPCILFSYAKTVILSQHSGVKLSLLCKTTYTILFLHFTEKIWMCSILRHHDKDGCIVTNNYC